MAGTIKGMTIEIGGNTAPLEQALKSTNKEIKSTQSELKEVNKLLKLDPNNVTLLKQKQELLTKAIGDSTTKLEALKQAQKQLDDEIKKGNPVNQAEYRKLEREILSTEQTISKLKEEAKQTNPKIQALKEGLAKAGEVAGTTLKAGLNLAIKGLEALTVSAVAGATALLKLGVSAGNTADDLNTLSATTGLSTEQLQKFKYASDLIDVDMNTLTGALKKTTSAMSSASKGTGKQAEAFKKLGVNIKNADGTLRKNNDVFEDSIRALAKISNETERDALAMELFGKSATELNPLIEGGIDKLNEMGDRAERLGLILSQEALDGANAFNDEIDILKANSQGIFGKIGNQVARDLLPYMQRLNKVTENVIGRLSKALDSGGISGLLDEIVAMFNEIDWGEVARNISQKFVDIFNGLGDFLQAVDWQHFGEQVVSFIANIDWGGLIRGVFNVIGGIISGAGQFLQGAFTTARDEISKWWEEKLEEAGGNGGKALLNGTKETIITSGSFLYDNVAQPLAQGVADAVNIDTEIPNFHKLSQNLGIWWEDLKWKWQNNVLLPVQTWFFDMEFKIKKFFEGVETTFFNAITWLGDTWNNLYQGILNVGTSVSNWFSDIFTNIGNFFTDVGNSIRDFFTVTLPNFWKSLWEKLQKIPEKLYNVGQNLVEGLWNGIKNTKDWLMNKLNEWCGSVVDGIKGWFGIESPSKVMANEVGTYMAQGIGVGFNKTLPSVITAMQEKLAGVTDAFRTELSIGDIPEIQGHTIVSENNYVTKNYTNTVETIRQPQAVELVLDGTKVARTLIPSLNNEYNRLGVKI